MNIDINPDVLEELRYLVSLHKQHGAPNQMNSVGELIDYVLRSIADGSRRPGSWERQLLIPMGLVPNGDAAHVYRSQYGPPSETPD